MKTVIYKDSNGIYHTSEILFKYIDITLNKEETFECLSRIFNDERQQNYFFIEDMAIELKVDEGAMRRFCSQLVREGYLRSGKSLRHCEPNYFVILRDPLSKKQSSNISRLHRENVGSIPTTPIL